MAAAEDILLVFLWLVSMLLFIGIVMEVTADLDGALRKLRRLLQRFRQWRKSEKP